MTKKPEIEIATSLLYIIGYTSTCCWRNSRLINAYSTGLAAELKQTNKWAEKNTELNVSVDHETYPENFVRQNW